MPGAKKPHRLNVESFIACAKDIGFAGDGGLNDWVIVGVLDDGGNYTWQFHHDASGFEKSEVLVYVLLTQGPSCLNVCVIR